MGWSEEGRACRVNWIFVVLKLKRPGTEENGQSIKGLKSVRSELDCVRVCA
jgi:hypothetical protein